MSLSEDHFPGFQKWRWKYILFSSLKIFLLSLRPPCLHIQVIPCPSVHTQTLARSTGQDKNSAPICTLQTQCSYLYFISGAGLEKYWNGISAERMWFMQCDYWIVPERWMYLQSETWNKEAEQTNPDALMWDELRNSGWARGECLGVMGQLWGCLRETVRLMDWFRECSAFLQHDSPRAAGFLPHTEHWESPLGVLSCLRRAGDEKVTLRISFVFAWRSSQFWLFFDCCQHWSNGSGEQCLVCNTL